MSESQASGPSVVVTRNGPYQVTGPVTVEYAVIATDDTGASWTWKRGARVPADERFRLCRCGHSSNKPFCDNTHREIGFDGTETASREPYEEQGSVTDGPTMSMRDVFSLCARARFCDGHGDAWSAVESSDTDEGRAIAAHEASHCPAGRLVVSDKSAGGTVLEPGLEPSIGLVEDPTAGVSGGLWLRGGIPVRSQDGTTYPTRNRMLLCRCGESANKPFCDGSHIEADFDDGALEGYDPEPDGTDSVVTPSV